MTITVIDPTHEFFGRVCVVTQTSEWYTYARPLYHSRALILTPEQFRKNEG